MGKKQNDAVVLSEEQQYTMLHNEIVQYGNMATTCFAQFMAKLKVMRDGKLYRAVGIETFEQYVEDEVGIKRSQAYKYIAVIEKLPLEFVHSSGQIGITKLSLLASLDEEDRGKLMEVMDVESTTVKELKQAIAGLDEQLVERDQQIAEQEQRIAEQQQEISEFDALLEQKNEQVHILSVERDAFKSENSELQNAVNNQKQQTEQMHSELQTVISKHQQVTEQLQKNEQEKVKLQQKIDALKKAPAKVETVDNPETVKALKEAQKHIEELETANKKLEAEQKDLIKKLELANDETMLRFKSKFDDFQLIGRDILQILSAMDDEKANKCKTALKAVVGGWQF